MRTKKEIADALARTETSIKECQRGALKAFAYQLAGHAFALRFALGLNERDNREAQIAVFKESPFFKARLNKLKKAKPR